MTLLLVSSAHRHYFLRISDLVQKEIKFTWNPTQLCTDYAPAINKERLNTSRARSWSGEPKGEQKLLILRNKFEMLKWSQTLPLLQTESEYVQYWTETTSKTSQELPMGFGPGFKSWEGMTTLKVTTRFPPWTWITWHFSQLIYCFSILEQSCTSALFSTDIPGNFTQWPGLLLGLISLFHKAQKPPLALSK